MLSRLEEAFSQFKAIADSCSLCDGELDIAMSKGVFNIEYASIKKRVKEAGWDLYYAQGNVCAEISAHVDAEAKWLEFNLEG